MKTLIILFAFTMLISFSSCGPAGTDTNVQSEYEDLVQRVDGLQKRHTTLLAAHDSVNTAHRQLSQRLGTATEVDTSWLEDLSKHEVMLRSQKATFNMNEQLFTSYNEFEGRRAQATEEEFMAKIEEMDEGLTRIEDNLDQVENDLETINNDQQTVREELQDDRQQQSM